MDFFNTEADEASSSEESVVDSDAEIKTSKPKNSKKKKAKQVLDSDEEEDDDETLDQNLEGFIDDNPDVEEEEDGSGGEESGEEGEKRKHEDSDLDEDLEDDDMDLIEENLGIKISRKKKHKRIRMVSDDESDKEVHEEDDRDAIARQIFDDDDVGSERGEREGRAEPEAPRREYTVGDISDSGEESEENFIVDDEGQPIKTKGPKRVIIHDDAALQEAQDIFGVDFDFEDFNQYDEGSEESDYEDSDYEEGAEREARAKKKQAAKTSIFKIFEPGDIERSHLTDQDQEIQMADMPERFQLRQVPICPTKEGEQELEAEWIYKQAFCTNPISRQDYWETEDGQGGAGRTTKPPETVEKIKAALNFMRNELFEVPFIAFYRKEYVEPELNINDLWKVYHWDEKWMQLSNRKQNLIRLFEKMQKFQFDSIDPEKPLESHVRALTEDDIERVRSVQTIEELRDVYQHFLLYYGTDIPKMKNFWKNKAKKEKQDPPKEGEEGDGEKKEEPEEEDDAETLKQASRKTGYSICVSAGLADMANKFGLEAEKLAENLRDNYQRHDVEQDPAEPQELALEFINNQFRTSEDVLKGARHMVAMQIAHDPTIKKVIRTVFYERAMLSAACTKKGMKEIDESHPCYSLKYLKNKPIGDLHNDQFLHIQQAVDDGNMTYEVHMDGKRSGRFANEEMSYFKEIESLYHRDEFSNLVQEWNAQRSEALERALKLILYPQLIKEVKSKLLEEAKEHILKSCCRKLYNYLKVAPYAPDAQTFDEYDDFDPLDGVRVLGMAFAESVEDASFACLIDGQGEVSDFLRLPYITLSRNSWRPQDKAHKENDIEKFKDFVESKKPHVIAISAANSRTVHMMGEIQNILRELEQESQIPQIPVELVDNEMSVIYANSNKAKADFREYPELLRIALSTARRIQEPLVEFAQMCNADEDILCLKYHTYQDCLSKDVLQNALYLEFVNRVNEVGVDVNKCTAHPHTSSLVQFVCGLGPRKGSHLLKILGPRNELENRTQLVTTCHMGPKVFINCAGFIKIDTVAISGGASTVVYVEVLDGSRVHPETYEWARKMAIDALEYDETANDANPAGALEEILENPEKLRELDLDAFAEELDRQGYGNKHITLYDIRAELNHRYKDLRVPYRPPTDEERFNMITKETPQTFHPGKLVLCRVTGIAHRKPKGEQLDQANPVRNDETGLWQCPFCQKSDFPELSEVWNHFDAQECAGQPMGVKVRLDNGVQGFIHVNSLSDKKVEDPSSRVKHGMTMHARIVKIDIERLSVNLTSKTSDLVDEDNKWKPTKDVHYDYDADSRDRKKEEDKKKQQARQTYTKRVIVHPSFHNVDYKGCVKLMENMDQGDVVIRPSSKGSDHLTCTWKVYTDILQHVDVREESKENAFSLGHSLWIGTEEYEDLDEIVARFVQPIAQFARDITTYKYYRDAEGGKRESNEKALFEEKRKAPSKIPYFLSASKEYPGKFLLSYLPRKSPRHEYVTVTPEGIRYRGQMFHSLSALVRWFKEHFRDPIPGATPASSTRTPASSLGQTPTHTPRGMRGLEGGKGLTGQQVFNQIQRMSGQTPMGGYQVSRTPMMTPGGGLSMHTPSARGHTFATPANPHATPQVIGATPQYQPTPRSSWPSATPVGGASSGSGRTPQATPTQRSAAGSGGGGGGASAQDWAKMAEMWAKRNVADSNSGTPMSRSSSRRSPRAGTSPYGGHHTPGTPRRGANTPRRTPGTPRDPRDAGSTPLYDEM